ncbi:MAG: hypothetical protein ACI9W6_002245 [Motiliproteus sp.]|jgi:hypothetical protein
MFSDTSIQFNSNPGLVDELVDEVADEVAERGADVRQFNPPEI